MANRNIEVERKILLGDIRTAELYRKEILALVSDTLKNAPHYPEWAVIGDFGSQTNHYFTGGIPELLVAIDRNKDEFVGVDKGFLQDIPLLKSVSVRTRNGYWRDNSLFIVKASLNDTTSDNGTVRREYEFEQQDYSQDELDAMLVAAGFTVQAKWSRERESYSMMRYSWGSMIVNFTIDRNSGYGYLAEIEVMCADNEVDEANHLLGEIMQSLKVKELPQDRLERMFAYYNANWQEYYLQDKFFVVE